MNPFRTIALNFEREQARLSYWLPVALAAGIVCYFTLPTEPPSWTMALPLAAGLAAWLMRYRSWPLAVALFAVATMALGFAAAQIETRLNQNPMLTRLYLPTGIQGRVAMAEIMPDGVRLTLTHPRIRKIPPDRMPEKIRIKFPGLTFADMPPTGSDIDFYGQVGGFSGPVAPHATDFRRLAYFRHLGGLGWSYTPPKILDPAPPVLSWGERFDMIFERARLALAHDVYRHLSGDVAAMTA
ncbi:MAG: hypothetical protein KGI97_08730, partial [Alphaproteobacteria bacterium]|nr:hypothetical protein [Alphaproteobacteria bacterium]